MSADASLAPPLFPYRLRQGQEGIVLATTALTRSGGALAIDAPAGFGKTVAVLAPLLAHAQAANHKIPLPGPNPSPGAPGPPRSESHLPSVGVTDPSYDASRSTKSVPLARGRRRNEGGDGGGAREAVRRPKAGDETSVRGGDPL